MNKSRIRVSIVIPAYNEEHHIKACLESIAAQRVRPYEVIVVDNNSADRTAKLARSFPFVKVVQESRQGRAFACNAGFDAVTGDVIGRIDADVQLPSEWVAHIQSFYAEPDHAQQAWCGGATFYNMRLPRLVARCVSMCFYVIRLLNGYYSLWGSNMAFTATQWQAVRHMVCLRDDIHEDLDLTIHLKAAGYGSTYDPAMKIQAELKRVQTNRRALKPYLDRYPTTMRIHHRKVWILCWILGVPLPYYGSLFFVIVDRLARALGKPRRVHLTTV